MTAVFSWFMVAMTILLTCYGQIIIKWQVVTFKASTSGLLSRLPPLVQLLFQPWIISAFIAAFGASLCWILAVSKLELSKAYPFMALNFLIVCLVAVPLFGESFSPAKAFGLLTVVAGLVIMSQA